MDKPVVSLRKRQQIGQANKMMFVWIIGASVVVGVSAVLVVFLVQLIVFQEKVIIEKHKTVVTLERNLKKVEPLKDEVRLLDTNKNLMSIRLSEDKPAVQSVLDALPADENPTALASSLQFKLLGGVPGIVTDSLSVVPTAGGAESTSAGELPFSFGVSTLKSSLDDNENMMPLRSVLERLEKSIRPFQVNSVQLEAQGARLSLSVRGVSFYEPAKTIELTNKVIKQ